MAHEIEENDKVVLHRTQAWHGLGMVLDADFGPQEAWSKAYPWTSEQWELSASSCDDAGTIRRIAISDKVANVRSDCGSVLGVVSKGWVPFQPIDLANFCYQLAEGNDTVKVESAGSIRNGKKIWMLLKGESFSVRGTDEVCPYIAGITGFDGTTATHFIPTTIRVVCSNTLHMVIPQYAEGGTIRKIATNSFSCNHNANAADKIVECKKALGLYSDSLDVQRGLIDTLAAKDVSREQVQAFFLECYTRDFGAVAVTPTTAKERRARDKASDAFIAVANRFDRERDLAGTTAWNALNSYTGWLQNDRGYRSKDADKAQAARAASNLFGTAAESSVKAMQSALAI